MLPYSRYNMSKKNDNVVCLDVSDENKQKPKGSMAARTEVTQYIIQYIKDNNLQWKDNRKIIKPNTPLKNLLDVKKSDEVTYFNIQRYMNKHFIKKHQLTK